MKTLPDLEVKNCVERNPISCLPPCRTLIWSLAAIKAAVAQVNLEKGILDEARAEAIVAAAGEVMEGRWADPFFMDPFQAGPGDYHRRINRLIAARATQILAGQPGESVHPDEHVNKNQSSPEVVSAALRISCLKSLEKLFDGLGDLTARLGTGPLPSMDAPRQRLSDHQTGAEACMSQEWREYIRAIARNADSLRNAADGLRRLSMKGPSTAATPQAQLEYQTQLLNRLAETSGLSITPSDHGFQSTQAVAEIDAFSAALRNLLLSLRRTADQLHRQEPAHSNGSGSAHPTVDEKLNQVMFRLQVCSLTIALAAQAGSPELNSLMPVIAYILFEAVQGLTEAARQLTEQIPAALGGYAFESQGFPMPQALLVNHSFDPTTLY